MADYSELKRRAKEIRDEVQAGANTASRVGLALEETVKALEAENERAEQAEISLENAVQLLQVETEDLPGIREKVEELDTLVINDLTTGGADKALSAEMGKVLGAKLTELESEVNGKATREELQAEVTRATNAESALSKSVQTETTRATAAELVLRKSINNEVVRAKESEEELENSVNANRYGYNVTVNGLNGGTHTIETAIKDVPSKFRMLGQKITFRTENGDWSTYHNESLSLDNYENVNDWVQEVGISSVQGDVNITNAPDYEDLTEAKDGTIKFADKEYNKESFSGLGRIFLRKNIVEGIRHSVSIQVTSAPLYDGSLSITLNGVVYDIELVAETHNTINLVAEQIAKIADSRYNVSLDNSTITFVAKVLGEGLSTNVESASGVGLEVSDMNDAVQINQLVQDMFVKANTIYIIQYDYDLQGAEITIPEGCVLDFQGGSLDNGTIIYNTTLLSGTPFINSINKGVVKNTILYASWFNIRPSARLDNKHDNSVYINNIKEIIIGRTLQFENGVYYFSSSIIFEDGYLTIKGSCAEWSSNEEDPRHKGTTFRLNENFVGDYLFDIVASYWSGSTRSVNLSNFCIDCNSRAGGIKANLYDASILSNINILRVPFNKEALFIGHPDGPNYAISQTCLLQNIFTNDNGVSIDSIEHKPLIRIFGMQEGTLINVKAGTTKRIAAEFDNCTGCSIICCSFCSSSKEGGLSVKSCNSMSFLNITFENTAKLVDFGASRIYLYWVPVADNLIPQKGDYLIQYADNEISFRGKVYLGGKGGANLEDLEGVFDNKKDIINETTGQIIGKPSNSEYRYNDKIKIIAPRVLGTFNLESSMYTPSYINYTRNSYLELIGESSDNDPHSVVVDKNVEDTEIITHNIVDSTNYSTSILSSSKFKQISLTNNGSESNAYTIVDGINELIIHGNFGQYFKAKLKNNDIDIYVFNVDSILTLKWDSNAKYYNYELIEGGFSSYSKKSIIDGKKYIHKNYDDTYIIAPRVGLFAYIQTNKDYFIYDDSGSYYHPIGSSYKIENNSSMITITVKSNCSFLFEGKIYENVSSIKSFSVVTINKLSENTIEILGKDVELVYNETLKINNFKSIPSTYRPNEPKAGYNYFDNSLNKPIWWTGTTWVDATGAEV